MSRVRPGAKHMNVPMRTKAEMKALNGPVVLKKTDNPNYRKAKNLFSWLFLKYDITPEQYTALSTAKKNKLKKEHKADINSVAEEREAFMQDYLSTFSVDKDVTHAAGC